MELHRGEHDDLAFHKTGTEEFVVCSRAFLPPGVDMGMSVSQGGREFLPDERFDQPHTEWKAAWMMEATCVYGDGEADEHIETVCVANGVPPPLPGDYVYMARADVLVREDTDVSLDMVMGQVIRSQLRYFSRLHI